MKRRVRGCVAAMVGVLLLALGWLPAAPAAQASTGLHGYFYDDFSSATLDPAWTVLGEDRAAWSLTQDPGSLTVTTRDASLYQGDNRPVDVFLRAAPSADYDLTTRLRFAPGQDYEQAGLLLWAGQDDYVQLTYSHQGGLALLAGVESKARFSAELVQNTLGDDVLLRVTRRGDRVSFAASADGNTWLRVGQPVRSPTRYTRVGLFTSSSGSGRAVPARFERLSASWPNLTRRAPAPPLPPDTAQVAPGPAQSAVPYTNPVQSWTSGDPATADPSVRRGPDGLYYMVGSESEYSYSPYHALPIFSSPDLVHWTYLSDVFPTREDYPAWAEDTKTDRIDFWAPDIVFAGGKVYVYFGATQKAPPGDDSNDKAIGVAVASSPTGPFTAALEPMVRGTTFRAIDEMVFTDDDGARYLYWGSAFYPLLAQRLADDGLSVTGPVHQVLPSHQGSVYFFDTSLTPYRPNLENLVEAPWVVKRGGWYYLYYSGPNCCGPGADYTVAVARSTSPTGPFDKLTTNPVLSGDERVLAPGHNAVVTDDAGQDWIVYHAMDRAANPQGDASRRNLYIDPITWKNGWPVVSGPTSTPQSRGPVITTASLPTDLPPTPASTVALGAVAATSATLSWQPATDDHGVTSYTVYRDGVAVGTTGPAATSAVVTGLTPCTRYALSVRAGDSAGQLGDAGTRVLVTTTGCPQGTASDHRIDRTTQGGWRGTYGAQGYSIAGDSAQQAAGADVTVPGGSYTWTPSSTEQRATQRGSGDGRLAATWFGSSVPIDVSVTDGAAHRVSLYLLDWDSGGDRRQSVTVTDLQGNVLDRVDAGEIGAYDGGVVLGWDVTGQVRITSDVVAGPNAVVSAVYVDPA